MSGLVAGLGCRRGVAVEALCSVVAQALHRAGQQRRDLVLLAVPSFKQGADFAQVAERFAVPLVLVEDAALQAVQGACLTRSAAAQRAVGLGSIAEAAALAAAGPGARLLGPRIALDGATCAVARQAAP